MAHAGRTASLGFKRSFFLCDRFGETTKLLRFDQSTDTSKVCASNGEPWRLVLTTPSEPPPRARLGGSPRRRTWPALHRARLNPGSRNKSVTPGR